MVGTIIFFMFLGYLLGNMEKENDCYEIIKTIKNGDAFCVISKVLLGTIIILIFSMVILCEVFIYYHTKNVSNSLYKESLKYIFWYYFVGINLFYIIGLIVGIGSKNKARYGLLLFIWLIFTPLNENLFNLINSFTIGDYSKIGSILNLFAPYPLKVKFNGIIGFPLKEYNKVKLLLVLMILIIILCKNYLKRCKLVKVIFTSSFLLAVIFSVYICGNFSKMIVEGEYRGDHSYNYYKNINNNDYKDNRSFSNYDIKECNLVIDVDNLKTTFNTDLDIQINEESDILTFSLYHGLNISNIKCGDKELTYYRDKDILTIEFPESIKRKYEIKLNLIYSGYTPASFFVGKEGMYLPPNLAYVPSNRNFNQLEVTKGGLAWNNLNYVSDYNVKVNGLENVYSNLQEVSKNEFSSKNAEGIFLISSNLMKKGKYKNMEYYYNDVYKAENFEQFIDMYMEVLNKLNKECKFNIDDDIKRIFFVDKLYITSELNLALIKQYDDSVIVNTDKGNPILSYEYLTDSILSGILNKDKFNLEYSLIEELFISSVHGALFDTNILENNANISSENLIDNFYSIIVGNSKQILDFYNSCTLEKKLNFIGKFYEFMKSDNVNVDTLNDFMLEYIK